MDKLKRILEHQNETHGNAFGIKINKGEIVYVQLNEIVCSCSY